MGRLNFPQYKSSLSCTVELSVACHTCSFQLQAGEILSPVQAPETFSWAEEDSASSLGEVSHSRNTSHLVLW